MAAVVGIICGAVAYGVMLWAMLWCALFATQDPEVRLGGALMSLFLIALGAFAIDGVLHAYP